MTSQVELVRLSVCMNAEILKTLRATKLEFGNANGILFCLHYFTAEMLQEG